MVVGYFDYTDGFYGSSVVGVFGVNRFKEEAGGVLEVNGILSFAISGERMGAGCRRHIVERGSGL